MIVAPSILSCDFSNLEKEVKQVVDCGAQFIHIDVMDGHFVPNITLGPVIYKNLKGKVNAVFDVHLMISDPLFYAKSFIDAGADYLTFHYEALKDVKGMINHIKSLKARVGISIKPNTKIEVLDNFLKDLDLVLVMSVEPGFGGQKFMDSAIGKVEYLARQKEKNNYKYLIEVDGGINYETAVLCKAAGAEVLVAGTYIFSSPNRCKTIKGLIDL